MTSTPDTPTTPETRRFWIAVDVRATDVDEWIGDALSQAADRAESVLQDEHGYKAEAWQTGRPDAVEDYPADDEQPADRLAILDGRDALAFVVIRPAGDDPERITVEASARGMSKAEAAYALRQTADQFDRAARAEGDEPITAEEAAAEQQQRARQAPDHERADGHDNGEWAWPDGQTYATPDEDEQQS
ncbi:hypothetical protein [Streptomyces sp. NPDC006996]|uniref:hypothetical protein n=1 Tax=Streptomyces sp. NPDC006996 TaxID=3156908 RepID=UPI0033C09104